MSRIHGAAYTAHCKITSELKRLCRLVDAFHDNFELRFRISTAFVALLRPMPMPLLPLRLPQRIDGDLEELLVDSTEIQA